jgi:hypothetical protein
MGILCSRNRPRDRVIHAFDPDREVASRSLRRDMAQTDWPPKLHLGGGQANNWLVTYRNNGHTYYSRTVRTGRC